jgi:hypothetical protein
MKWKFRLCAISDATEPMTRAVLGYNCPVADGAAKPSARPAGPAIESNAALRRRAACRDPGKASVVEAGRHQIGATKACPRQIWAKLNF